MATLLQIDANRRNSLNSTGPRTPEGKAAVRLNSLSHGLRAATVLLPNEKREDFQQLAADLELEWQPQTRTEQFYLEQMLVSQWKLRRMEIGEILIFRDEFTFHNQLPPLDRIWQCQARLEKSYARSQHELERLQSSRPPHEPEPLAAPCPAAPDPPQDDPPSGVQVPL